MPKLGTASDHCWKKYSEFRINVPGKLKARPVAQPATPALITANRDVSSYHTFNSKYFNKSDQGNIHTVIFPTQPSHQAHDQTLNTR
jgi:hypothetical protein